MIALILTIHLIAQPLYEVEGIVVTATRYPEKLQDIATATVVITKNDIEKMKPTRLTEILQYAGGVVIKDYGSPGGVGSLSIRGIPASGILVLLNGQPLNSMLFGMADLSVVDINSIKRIEIVKGPCSALYGANALGGVINIITEDFARYAQAKISISAHRHNYFLKFSIPAGDFGYYLEQSKSDANSMRTNSDFSGYYVKSGLFYKKGPFRIKTDLGLTIRDFGVPGPMPYVDSITPPPIFGDSQSTSLYDHQKDIMTLGNLDITFMPDARLNFALKLYGNHPQINYYTKYYWAGTIEEEYHWDVQTAGMNLMANYNLRTLKFVGGVDFRYDTLNSITKSTASGTESWQASTHNIGYWIETKVRPFRLIKINTSLRLDKNSGYGNFLSPQLGIVYQLSDKFLIKGSAGRAFRAPTFNDLYYPTGGDPEIRPEYGEAYELRAEVSPRYNIFTSLALFMRNITDKITWLPDNRGLWQPKNVDNVNIKGVETQFHIRPGDHLRFTIEATYLYARQENHELVYSYYDWSADTSHIEFELKKRPASFIPEYKISAKLYIRLDQQWSFNIINSYVGEQVNYYLNYEDSPWIKMDEKVLAPYFLLDLALNKRFSRGLEMSLGIKNLLDQNYATQFGNSIRDLNYPMPGRRIFGQVYFSY